MNQWLRNQQRGLISCLLGAALTFAFAPYEIYPLAILAPAGLLALINGKSPKEARSLGFKFGLGLFGAGVYWIYISINTFGDVPAIGAFAITVAFIAILSLYPALTCYLTNRYFPTNDRASFNYAFPAIWVFSEWLRGILFTGFPWFFIGYSQTNSPLSGLAPIFGVYGVSLAVMLSSSFIIYAITHYRQQDYLHTYKCLFAMLAIWMLGAALSVIPWTKSVDKSVSVSLVQGNIPQSLKWDPDNLKLSFDRYTKLTKGLLKKDHLIIWPEAAIPMPLQQAEDYINMMDDLATKANAHILLGIPIYNEVKQGYLNALVSLGKDRSVYSKRLLVPFGEYVPLFKYTKNLFHFMKIPVANTIPGNFRQPIFKVGDLNILPSICYEIAFPDLMRTMNQSVDLLLTITNDAWYGKSNAQAQHLQMAAMRAIEMRRPALFVSNDGITAVINSDGTVLSAVPPHSVQVLNTEITPMHGLTPWMRNGADPILFILILMLIASRRIHRTRQEKYAASTAT